MRAIAKREDPHLCWTVEAYCSRLLFFHHKVDHATVDRWRNDIREASRARLPYSHF
jgi:hypothetical protein